MLLETKNSHEDKLPAKVLNRMGLEDFFEGVICFETLNPNNDVSPNDDNLQNLDILKHISESNVSNSSIELPKSPILCKPSVDAMTKALKLANIDSKRTIFFDDSIRNIQAGKEIGLQTVLVDSFTFHVSTCCFTFSQQYKTVIHPAEAAKNTAREYSRSSKDSDSSG